MGKNIGKSIRILLDIFWELPMGMTVIFCLGLLCIGIVIDTMITYTFPAYTLIGIIITFTSISMKIYERHLINKNSKKYN